MEATRPKSLDRNLTEIGERTVAYELQKKGWQVMLNLGGLGFDIFAKKKTNGLVERHIEVKTTDPETKTGNIENTCGFWSLLRKQSFAIL